MAKRRKVGNLLGLAVLSTLVERPMHPYEIASLLRERNKERDMNIKWGSLYTVVGNLEKHGFVAAVESVREGGRPERTVYRLTPAGRAEYEDWVRELLSTPEREQPRFEAGLSVMAVLGPDEVVALLGRRADLLAAEIIEQRETLARVAEEIPRLLLAEAEYDLAMRSAELNWVRSFVAELASGEMPGVEAWRHWFKTGEIPDDMSELAERGSTQA
ncbi:helix-turn-helix transcriptional regulator [Amycolatopsis sp. NPDC059027]|uniref:helix-turn-helix transcriptional regulator n=1 Tax=Amycolatopsis sp. NPDC059027 TaxID=3346709 RepID=UPI00366ABCDB